METESSKSAQPNIPPKEEPKEFELDIIYDDPHNGYPITQIDCSPKMEYVATLSEFDKSVVLWSVDTKSQSLQYENTISNKMIDIGSETSTTFAVSDNGCVAIKLRRLNPRNFEIYNLKKKPTETSLHFPYLHKNISHLSFTNNGNLVMISTNEHKTYIFYPKETDNHVEWIFKSMIEMKNFSVSDRIYITPKGKLIFFKKETYEITIWNLKTLSIEAQILLDWNFNFECVGLSDDEELLGISASSSKSKSTYLYVFSTTNGMNLSKYTYEESVMIDGIHFIASNFGERILITSHVLESLERIKMDLNVHRFHDEKLTFDYDLMDPHNLTDPVSADKLFRRLKATIKMPYIIKLDCIIYANEEQLFIEKLVNHSVKDNWINYLRMDLNDYNKISTPPGKKDIIDFIRTIDSTKYIQATVTYEGYLTEWTLSCKDVMFTLDVSQKKYEVSGENKREPVHEKKQQKANMYVRKCKILKNDDLVMVTEKCVILWTFNQPKGISVHYIWGVGKDVKDKYWEAEFNGSLTDRFLPQSDFDGIIKEINMKSDKVTTNLYDLLLNNYIEEIFFLAYCGKELMERFLNLNMDWWIEQLCENCVKKCLYDKDGCDLQSNIQLLSIIAQFYSELIQTNPAIIYNFLAQMAFVVPSIENYYAYYNSLSSSPHLYHYNSYYNLHEISHINNVFFIISKYWLVFKNNYNTFIQNQLKPLENYYRKLFSFIQNYLIEPFENYYRIYYLDHGATIKLLFPLPYFVNYPKKFNVLKEFWKPKSSSFTKSIDLELYKTWNATLSNDISWTHQQILLVFAIILGIWQFIFEFRQFIYSPILYITSPWNYIDLGAILLPTITSIIWLKNYTAPTWTIIFSTLLLELKFLTYFRAIAHIGVYFAMIIGVAKRAFLFLIILAFIVFAFAHSLHLLLRPATGISLDQSNYSNDPNNPWNLATKYYTVNPDGSVNKNPILIEPPNESTNMFSTLISAILAVYIMLTGDTSSLSPWALNENISLTILVVIFSFFTTIYLMNLFIGLLSDAINETNNKEYFLIQRAEVGLFGIIIFV
ncbi:transient receptor potential cation channel subfamily a member 1-like [Gigaspora margarita]|uniref:Transient receptor potential cation channel subfamily a member 1-like n=1 Tax=Gigaspora margarita TaxID=4874 RepID=A0A8H4EKT6_GIGMA|nr:transient receptor potential cation channel subfamily a member 1-like [Gigaspora margarita]